MMTRKQFGGKLLSAVAAGTLANSFWWRTQ